MKESKLELLKQAQKYTLEAEKIVSRLLKKGNTEKVRGYLWKAQNDLVGVRHSFVKLIKLQQEGEENGETN